jgi:hypothetical protein
LFSLAQDGQICTPGLLVAHQERVTADGPSEWRSVMAPA